MSTFIDEIKKIPITDYAERMGYTLVKKGSRYVSLKEHDSVMIDTEKNAYWQNSEFTIGKKGGAGSVIDFAMNMQGYDLNTALRELAQMYGIEGNRSATVQFKTPTYKKPSSEKKREAGDIELPKAAKNNDAVIKYLTEKRHIKPQIVQSFIDRGMLYQDEKRNCVFHTERFGCKRSTGEKRFAIDLKGNDYNECFLVQPQKKSKLNATIVVTEAVIDLMSVQSFLSDKRDYNAYTYLALTGTNKTASLFNALDKNPALQTVVLALDNDEAGRKATEAVMAELKERGISCVDFPAKEGKDWNEYISILAEREAEASQAVEDNKPIQMTQVGGNDDFFRKFQAEQEEDIAAFQDKTGWAKLVIPSGEVIVYRSEQDLPDSIYEYLQTQKQLQTQKENAVSAKIESFQNETVKEIAQYYMSKGGNAAYILSAPADVSVETISAVTDAAANNEINELQADAIYAAMQRAAEWNVSNYQEQEAAGMHPMYRLDSEFMNRLPYSLCSFAANGKSNDYLLEVVTDYIDMEQENFQQDLENFKTMQRGIEIEMVQPIPEQPVETSHSEEIPREDIQFVAIESTHDYSDDTFKSQNGQEQYRWITLTVDGTHVEPLNGMVFNDPAEARLWRFGDDRASKYEEKTYDELCDKAYMNHSAAKEAAQKQQKELISAIQQKSAEIDNLNQQLKDQQAIATNYPDAKKAISVTGWSLETLQRFQQEYAVYEYNSLKGEIKGEMPPLTDENRGMKSLVVDVEKWQRFVADRLAEVNYLENPPTITCEWSESQHFEDGKTYPFAEFNDKMGEVDAKHLQGYREAMEYYHEDDTAFWDDIENGTSPYAEFASPYEKTKFTVNIPNIGSFTERQDIGDGDGNTIAFLAKIEGFKPMIHMLQEVCKQQKEIHTETDRKDEKTEKANDIMEKNNSPKAVYVDGKPTWYAQIDEIRLNNSVYDINAELAERKGVESGRDPFADTPLDSLQENILIVAALTAYTTSDLQMLADTVKGGINTISLPLENGDEFLIDVKSKFIDMAKAYVSEMEKQQPELEAAPAEPIVESEPEQAADVEKTTPEPEAEQMNTEEPTVAEESSHGEDISDTAEQPAEDGFDKTKTYTLEYRLKEIEALLKAAEQDKNLLSDEEKQKLNETKEQLVNLIAKLEADKGDKMILTPDETALTEDTDKWLSERKDQMDSKERVAFELTEGIKSVMQSENYKNWLDTNSKYFATQYSFQNAILVYLQNQNASYTMSYDKWKYYGRQVMQGEEGIRILRPKLVYEKGEGTLFRQIKNGLIKQLAQNPNAIANYRLGISKLEFTMNSNHVIGLKIGGKERMTFASDEILKKFIDNNILGKVPVGYSPVSVFDVSQTEIAKELYVKPSEVLPSETIVKDENGKNVTNKRGEVRIVCSDERRNRFRVAFPEAERSENDKEKKPLTPEKVAILYEVLKAVNMGKNVPVFERTRQEDEELKKGASGYFDRTSSSDCPNGYIVIQSDMSASEKLKVLFHETAHADLHGNLQKLADEMQLDKKELGTTMRETQAESVAYALGKEFGIETSTDSFAYLAAYSRGFELQELQKSMNVIHKEVQELRKELASELEARHYDLALNPIKEEVLSAETIDEKTKQFVNYATEQITKAQTDRSTVPDMIEQYQGNDRIVTIVSDIDANCQSREYESNVILSSARSLVEAKDRAAQDIEIEIAQNSMRRIDEANVEYDNLMDRYIDVVKDTNDLRKEYAEDKIGTLKKISADYPRLAALSDAQLAYISKSKICAKEVKYLNGDVSRFVDKCCERAEMLPQIAAKNGTFIEVSRCEQWTNPAVFKAGTLCHPRIAERITENAEMLIRKLKEAEEAKGSYMPATRCEISVYSVLDGQLQGLSTVMDIGDGEQNSLQHHMQQLAVSDPQIAKLTKILEEAIQDKDKYADKIFVSQETPVKDVNTPDVAEHGLDISMEEWQQEIQEAKKEVVMNALLNSLNQQMGKEATKAQNAAPAQDQEQADMSRE